MFIEYRQMLLLLYIIIKILVPWNKKKGYSYKPEAIEQQKDRNKDKIIKLNPQ